MEPVIIGCDGCGSLIRIRTPDLRRNRACPRCQNSLDYRLSRELEIQSVVADPVFSDAPPGLSGMSVAAGSSASFVTWDQITPRIPSLPSSYAATLLFLIATAGLLASALHSLGADEPSVSFGFRSDRSIVVDRAPNGPLSSIVIAPAIDHPSPEIHASRTPQPPIDLPDQVFALGALAFADGGNRPGLQTASSDLATRSPSIAPAGKAKEPRRIKIRDQSGRVVVARLHGEHNGDSTYILPDGQLGIPTRDIETEEPFRPLTADELHDQLAKGLFASFQSLRTAHYVIFYQSKRDTSRRFAERSGELLENLYKGLTETFRKREIPIHDLEFPLVVVIFDSEKEFRAHKKVAPDVQAYYEIFTNRIYLYETSELDRLAPEVATLRKPQTVAHEGTHQILANIGVQPRLAAWPIWLIEGLAEYCASPVQDRKGNVTWNGLGMINALHMATIRDLEDPRAMQVRTRQAHASRTGRDPGKPLLESLIRAEQLSPTDYALAWALTHYLALKRGDDFVKFLVEMSKVPPLETRAADDHVAAFRKAFGTDLAKLDKQVAAYLVKLAKQKGYDHLPYYAVVFEQPLGNGLLRRAAMVSQSPSMIQQWIQEMSSPRGAVPIWHAMPHPTRSRAAMAAEEFMRNN